MRRAAVIHAGGTVEWWWLGALQGHGTTQDLNLRDEYIPYSDRPIPPPPKTP